MAERVILDVDPGVDDALAMLLAFGSPELDVLAVTVVNGNVPIETGARNASAVAAFAGRSDVRVLRGASAPLCIAPFHTFEVHGRSGLGDSVLADGRPGEDGAVAFIVETLLESPGEVTVAAVGPLTNLALAEQRSPGVLRMASRVVVMGGAIGVPGNTSALAEYNFYADPQAAQQVLESGADITLVPLDVTQEAGVSGTDIAALSGRLATDRAHFFEEATRVVVALGRRTGGYAGVHLHDPAAIAYLIQPDLFGIEKMNASVEPAGKYTAGMVVVDRRPAREGRVQGWNAVDVAVRVEADRVVDFFLDRALGQSE